MDKLLNITLTHEFYRCSKAFENFCHQAVYLKSNPSKKDRIDCYNSYVDFLSHLYEFYSSFINKELKNNKAETYKIHNLYNVKKQNEKHDIILNNELRKLLRNRKNRIVNGFADNLAKTIDFYNEKFPEKFAEHFRYMRNIRNHSDFRRASDNHGISLKDFFKLYHGYILIMYHETKWLWNVDIEKYEWNGIEEFAIEILK
ncbi:hypothetical protein M0M57_08175 [Flavobacterium azooxidireducens]|uniref:HEPN AbiU2-like domain-containing protein n=1 Tax=Flavobacterium azooxidireducens TaxID=1871076 RepID=A0ABY4KJS5_9FLAO|nr:hypothetical protein [Flavobacterium azooxidireducens]UPQ80804.1 hypothetical protein M0M57_08175 [Flavobacterium azooxidireducens]